MKTDNKINTIEEDMQLKIRVPHGMKGRVITLNAHQRLERKENVPLVETCIGLLEIGLKHLKY